MKKLLMLVLVAVIVTGLSFAGSITVNSPHGGEVWVEPGLENGTTFYISIDSDL